MSCNGVSCAVPVGSNREAWRPECILMGHTCAIDKMKTNGEYVPIAHCKLIHLEQQDIVGPQLIQPAHQAANPFFANL